MKRFAIMETVTKEFKRLAAALFSLQDDFNFDVLDIGPGESFSSEDGLLRAFADGDEKRRRDLKCMVQASIPYYEIATERVAVWES